MEAPLNRPAYKPYADAVALSLIVVVLLLALIAVKSVNKAPDCFAQQKHSDVSPRQQSEETLWRASTWLPTTVGTFALVVVAGVQAWLFVWQLTLIRSGTHDAAVAARAATQSADAAKLSADAAVAVEMPILTAASPEIGAVDGPIIIGQPYAPKTMGKAVAKHMVISAITIENHGRTGATITMGAIGWQVCGRPRGEPVYHTEFGFNKGNIIKANGRETFYLHIPLVLDDETFVKSQQPGSRFWIYITIHYVDFLRKKREARFCWRWGCSGGSFYHLTADDDAPEAYTRHT